MNSRITLETKFMRFKWGTACCDFALSNFRHIQHITSLSLNFAYQAIIYSIYSYFLLKSQSSTDSKILLLCRCFFPSEFPSLCAFIFLTVKCLKLNTISQAFEKGLRGFLTVKTSPRFFKSAFLENSHLAVLSMGSLITTVLFICGPAFPSLKGLCTLGGSYSSLTLSLDINLTEYFCFSVYFLFEVFRVFLLMLFFVFQYCNEPESLRKYLQSCSDVSCIHGSFQQSSFLCKEFKATNKSEGHNQNTPLITTEK